MFFTGGFKGMIGEILGIADSEMTEEEKEAVSERTEIEEASGTEAALMMTGVKTGWLS